MDFLKRHKTKLALAGGAIGSLYIINKVLSSYEKQWEKSSSRGFVHEARKKEIQFENIITHCNEICTNISPKLMAQMRKELNVSSLIERLGDDTLSNSEKLEIWKSLRLKLLSQLLGEIYSTCILTCYLRVQMSVIGGQLFFANITSPVGTDNTKAYNKYVALVGSHHGEKYNTLIQPIMDAVEDALNGFDLRSKVTLQDFKIIFGKVKQSMSFFLSSPTSKTKVFFLHTDKLSSIDVSNSAEPLNEKEETMLRQMLGETQDILESDDFQCVLESSLEVGYSILEDLLVGAFIKMESKLSGKVDGFSNPNSIQIPLIRILPEINSAITSRTQMEERALVNHLLCLDVLNCFAANVYEAFCQPR